MHDPKKIAKVQRWVDEACRVLHVPCHVRVERTYAEAEHSAEISRSGNGAHICLHEEFFTKRFDPEDQRLVLAHELAHTYFYAYDDAVMPFVARVLSEVDQQRLDDVLQTAEHRVIIESLQRVLVRVLPMPRF